MSEHDELDVLLDSALGRYGEAPAGIEGRVLRRIAAESVSNIGKEKARAPRRAWLWWAIPVPVAALAVALLWMNPGAVRHRSQTPPPQQARGDAEAQSHNLVTGERATSPDRRAIPHVAKRSAFRSHSQSAVAALPKRDTFPTVEPLTSEEHALVQLAGGSSESARKALIEAQREADQPLDIAAIHIQPLEMSDVATH